MLFPTRDGAAPLRDGQGRASKPSERGTAAASRLLSRSLQLKALRVRSGPFPHSRSVFLNPRLFPFSRPLPTTRLWAPLKLAGLRRHLPSWASGAPTTRRRGRAPARPATPEAKLSKIGRRGVLSEAGSSIGDEENGAARVTFKGRARHFTLAPLRGSLAPLPWRLRKGAGAGAGAGRGEERRRRGFLQSVPSSALQPPPPPILKH